MEHIIINQNIRIDKLLRAHQILLDLSKFPIMMIRCHYDGKKDIASWVKSALRPNFTIIGSNSYDEETLHIQFWTYPTSPVAYKGWYELYGNRIVLFAINGRSHVTTYRFFF